MGKILNNVFEEKMLIKNIQYSWFSRILVYLVKYPSISYMQDIEDIGDSNPNALSILISYNIYPISLISFFFLIQTHPNLNDFKKKKKKKKNTSKVFLKKKM